ncbi:MAG: Glycerol kinase [bacterium ADurb.Bin236]|nr:MAG: Glycerol kinase [bacterium ADurb.Bin236]HPN94816.1 glycerol kinase GlpK [bacterium]
MPKPYILAIDQGTTGTTAMVFGPDGRALAKVNREFTQYFPKPGWVEHDPMEIWASAVKTIGEATKKSGVKPALIQAIGITNQRETTVMWDRRDGKPIHNAIVWQCRRTANICDGLKKAGMEKTIRKKTGLVVDAYFSGTKVKWLLDNVKGARAAASKGFLKFGTIDSWLIDRLTAGGSHVIEISNASRTMLYNIKKLEWDADILKALDIPVSILPEVVESSGIIGRTKNVPGLPDGIPISGVAGDQQAALFGQTCFAPGTSKCTYGTGSFLLMNTGEKPVESHSGLVTTIGWKTGGKTTYALEGSAFICGAAIQWLRDGLKIIKTAAESEKLAASVSDNGGVYFVPALVGLGAPHWDMYARGAVLGLTRGATSAHLARAALEAMCYQTRDIVDAMAKDSGIPLKSLFVDGGAVANNLLMQFQADILRAPVDRPKMIETTALGSAFLAGLGVGIWKNLKELEKARETDRLFKPAMKQAERDRLYSGWRRAVERASRWEQPDC